MAYQILPVTRQDLPKMAKIWALCLKDDIFWQGLVGPLATLEEQCDYLLRTLEPRIRRAEFGVCRTYKIVNGEGEIVGWGGLGTPVALTEEQQLEMKHVISFPPGGSKAMYEWFGRHIMTCIERGGYDPTTCYQRQVTMIAESHQRQGLGSMLTDFLSKIADEGNAPTYVRARPKAAALFVQMGYEVLERVDCDLKDFGIDLGGKETRTSTFAMKRMPGARSVKGKRLDWSGLFWNGEESEE